MAYQYDTIDLKTGQLVMDLPPGLSLSVTDICKVLKHNLKIRSGLTWSVTHGRGTAYGWIQIVAPKARLVHDFMSKEDQELLGALLGLGAAVHYQGESIPSGGDFHREYVQRSAGKTPTVRGKEYWD